MISSPSITCGWNLSPLSFFKVSLQFFYLVFLLFVHYQHDQNAKNDGTCAYDHRNPNRRRNSRTCHYLHRFQDKRLSIGTVVVIRVELPITTPRYVSMKSYHFCFRTLIELASKSSFLRKHQTSVLNGVFWYTHKERSFCDDNFLYVTQWNPSIKLFHDESRVNSVREHSQNFLSNNHDNVFNGMNFLDRHLEFEVPQEVNFLFFCIVDEFGNDILPHVTEKNEQLGLSWSWGYF